MLLGTVFFFSLETGDRLAEMDPDATADYAQRVSRSDPKVLVQWRASESPDVRYFHLGAEQFEKTSKVLPLVKP